MAHYAKIGLNNRVEQVTVIDNSIVTDKNGIEHEKLGEVYLQKLTGYPFWKKTSYTGKIRKNYASVGMIYDEERDAFYTPQPYPSWVFDEELCMYRSPVPHPADKTKPYSWDENTQSWIADE